LKDAKFDENKILSLMEKRKKKGTKEYGSNR
jgi:hypothetical protein